MATNATRWTEASVHCRGILLRALTGDAVTKLLNIGLILVSMSVGFATSWSVPCMQPCFSLI
jgi:hypothetical protein